MKTLEEALASISTVRAEQLNENTICNMHDTILRYKEIAEEVMNSDIVQGTVLELYLRSIIELLKSKGYPFDETLFLEIASAVKRSFAHGLVVGMEMNKS